MDVNATNMTRKKFSDSCYDNFIDILHFDKIKSLALLYIIAEELGYENIGNIQFTVNQYLGCFKMNAEQ